MLSIIDFTKVSHFDATASLKLREFMSEIRKYAGDRVEVRFVGLAKHVRERFERARPGWHLVDGDSVPEDTAVKKSSIEEIRVFRSVGDAVAGIRYGEVEQVMEEKMKSAEHKETV